MKTTKMIVVVSYTRGVHSPRSLRAEVRELFKYHDDVKLVSVKNFKIKNYTKIRSSGYESGLR